MFTVESSELKNRDPSLNKDWVALCQKAFSLSIQRVSYLCLYLWDDIFTCLDLHITKDDERRKSDFWNSFNGNYAFYKINLFNRKNILERMIRDGYADNIPQTMMPSIDINFLIYLHSDGQNFFNFIFQKASLTDSAIMSLAYQKKDSSTSLQVRKTVSFAQYEWSLGIERPAIKIGLNGVDIRNKRVCEGF